MCGSSLASACDGILAAAKLVGAKRGLQKQRALTCGGLAPWTTGRGMSKKTAVIVGATGSIGRELVPLVTSSPHYDKLIVLHYRPTALAGRPKIEERIVDFSRLAAIALINAGTLFCCIGTTQKKAGS